MKGIMNMSMSNSDFSGFGEFGQLMAILNLANQATAAGVNTLITKKHLRGEEKLYTRQLRAEEQLHALTVQQRKEAIQAQIESEMTRDAAYQDIALYAGIGLVALVILVSLGVMFVGKKRDEQFSYLLEGV